MQRQSKVSSNNSNCNNDNNVWIHHLFLRNGYYKCRERYSHSLNHVSGDDGGSCGGKSGYILIPDGSFLRKYLSLMEHLFSPSSSATSTISISSSKVVPSSTKPLALILLESIAEYMDYCNMCCGEQAAVRERNRVLALLEHKGRNRQAIQQERYYKMIMMNSTSIDNSKASLNDTDNFGVVHAMLSHSSSDSADFDDAGDNCVWAFPDLSVRVNTSKISSKSCDDAAEKNDYENNDEPGDADDEYYNDNDYAYDEFELLEFSLMDTPTLCRRALLRAAKLFLRSSGNNNNTVVILSEDDALKKYAQEENRHQPAVAAVNVWSCQTMLNTIINDDNAATAASIRKLAKECEDEHIRRNPPTLLLTESDNMAAANTKGILYTPYITPPSNINELAAYQRGTLQVTAQNHQEGYVTVNSGSDTTQYFINNAKRHFNRALSGDTVLIEILSKSKWGYPIGRRRLIHSQTNDDAQDEDADQDDNKEDEKVSNDNSKLTMPTAQVVAIIKPNYERRRRIIATLISASSSSSAEDNNTTLIVTPMDPTLPKIRIRTKSYTSQFLNNKRLLVELPTSNDSSSMGNDYGWDANSRYPSGRIIQIVGTIIGDLETEVQCLLIERNLDQTAFSKSALACLPPSQETQTWDLEKNVLLKETTSKELLKRRDLRNVKGLQIFSVDPPGCQDIDDAMHARVLPNGNIEIGVHIADVDFFVPQNTPLDLEASQRATTFYLVDRRFDMLPSLLSSDLCSLHGKADRLAVSVIWEVSSNYQRVESTWFGRTIIRNIAAMTYEQAHRILNQRPPDAKNSPVPPPLTAGGRVDSVFIPGLRQDLTLLTRMARTRKKHREQIGGAVDLSSSSGSGSDRGSELKFTLDTDGKPVEISIKKEMEIHSTIAELMIMANEYVATRIHSYYPDSALVRIHQAVEESRFSDLEAAFSAGGMTLDGSSNKHLASSLQKAKEKNQQAQRSVVDSLFQSLATRAMSEAQYVCTGLGSDKLPSLSHYGLGLECYTHFTSPIRRYADVIVHRLLLASLRVDLFQNNTRICKVENSLMLNAQRNSLKYLPSSNAMSVLGAAKKKKSDRSRGKVEDIFQIGNDKGCNDSDEELDLLLECSSNIDNLQSIADPSPPTSSQQNNSIENSDLSYNPYQANEVSKQCQKLNQQNRMAKKTSIDCQTLFLSLYFHISPTKREETSAVILDVRENGLLVYVPKFDRKGAVYLADNDGHVHIDPAMMGLKKDAGTDPSQGFSAVSTSRKFAGGRCTLVEESNPDSSVKQKNESCQKASSFLRVTIPEGNRTCEFRILDAITVQLSCDGVPSKARIPPPRIHLVRNGIVSVNACNTGTDGSRDETQMQAQKGQKSKDLKIYQKEQFNSETYVNNLEEKGTVSMYQVIDSIPIVAKLPPFSTNIDKDKRSKNTEIKKNRNETMRGRYCYHQFKNPDTLKGTQEAAAEKAHYSANQGPSISLYHQNQQPSLQPQEKQSGTQRYLGGRDEYQINRQVESDVTSRTQRLHSQKRATRRSKAGK